jgi:hypothetical protein
MIDDTGFVKRTFPASAKAIDELAARSESFHELCHDFSFANEQMGEWETSSAPERDERYAEYAELVDVLGKEIEAALANSKISKFPGRC